MKNILLLTDLSKGMENVNSLALRLCSRLRCDLQLLNVFNGIPYVPALDPGLYQAKWYGELYNEHRKQYGQLAGKIQLDSIALAEGTYHPGITSVMVEGDLGNQVKQSVYQDQIEMVIMGAGKSGALAHLLFGDSVTEVIKAANVPVLIVPENTGELKENGKVVFATDFNKNDLAACAYLSVLGNMLNFTTEVVHVKSKENIEPFEMLLEKEFVEHLKIIGTPGLSYRHLMGENIPELLGQWSEILGASWLSLSEHHRSFFLSVFKKNSLRLAISGQRMPLLVFPEDFEHRDYFCSLVD